MRTIVTINDQARADDGHELTEKIQAADESLRKSFAGLGRDQVVPEVERSVRELGIELSPAVVEEWAQHVVDRTDYELVID
ncbi:MAG: hypothetical protein JWP31_1511 [Aeromicrobium sp.]|nr:hypothetical protein [Aeromicrobium sp.]